MNKSVNWIVVTLFVCCFMIFGFNGQAQAGAKTFKWNSQSIFPAGSSLYKEFVSFTEKVKEATGGRLVITHTL